MAFVSVTRTVSSWAYLAEPWIVVLRDVSQRTCQCMAGREEGQAFGGKSLQSFSLYKWFDKREASHTSTTAKRGENPRRLVVCEREWQVSVWVNVGWKDCHWLCSFYGWITSLPKKKNPGMNQKKKGDDWIFFLICMCCQFFHFSSFSLLVKHFQSRQRCKTTLINIKCSNHSLLFCRK